MNHQRHLNVIKMPLGKSIANFMTKFLNLIFLNIYVIININTNNMNAASTQQQITLNHEVIDRS